MMKKINNIFNVSNDTNSVIKVESDGYCVINKLALIDNVTGDKWEIKISNGELIIEPVGVVNKRNYKIEKLLNE